MDKIILNPPYLRNLYADICFVASHHGKEAVMLSPKGAILEKDGYSELSKHLTDFYDVSENSTSLKQYLSSVPYFIGEHNFTAEEKQCISEVMKGFGNIWYYDKSMAEKGTVNLGHINCKVNFDWTDCAGDEKLFKE